MTGERRMRWILRSLMALSMGVAPPAGAQRRPRLPAPKPWSTEREARVCAGEHVPKGWIKTNTETSLLECGVGERSNVWIISRIDDKPAGAEVVVCADAPLPAGWRVVSRAWDPARCGRPDRPRDNVKTIRRSGPA